MSNQHIGHKRRELGFKSHPKDRRSRGIELETLVVLRLTHLFTNLRQVKLVISGSPNNFNFNISLVSRKITSYICLCQKLGILSGGLIRVFAMCSFIEISKKEMTQMLAK